MTIDKNFMPNKTKQKIKHLIALFFVFALFLIPNLYSLNAAETKKETANLGKLEDFLKDAAGGSGAGYDTSKTEAEPIIGSIIKILLSFLGIVFLILVIYGGFMWMTARGNEQQVETARNIIVRATIGLAVVMFAYAITWFIVYQLGETAGFQQT